MAKGNVFISYRRDDAAGFCHAVRDRLVEHIPNDRVFLDVVQIDIGSDFAHRIESAVDQCDVVLALIGSRWNGPQDGASRLSDPTDWVRLEVASAFRRGVRVIPVLLDGAKMPRPETLPEDIRAITRINAMDVRSSRLAADTRDLTGQVMQATGRKWPPDEPGGKIYAAAAGIYAFFAGAACLFVMLASMFMESVPTVTLIGLALIALAATVILRLPLHSSIRTMSRKQSLRVGAILHIAAIIIMASQDSSIDAVAYIVFGFGPAALLFLASYAMQKRALA